MSTQTIYDAIVIGGGPNGLICGAYLAKAGAKVLLCERRHETGGGLNTDEYFGFRLNLHAVYHLMGERMPAHRDLELADLGVRYLYPHIVAAFPFRDGSSLVFTRDSEETAQSIAQFDTEDANAFRKMWHEFQPLLNKFLIPMTYELPNPALDQMVAFEEEGEDGRFMAEISEWNFIEILDHYGFKNPRVRMALLSFPAMWGLHLNEPLGFLYPLYLCRMLSAGLVKGGSHRLSSAMFRSFLRSGGRIIDEYAVTKILMEDGKAVGVRLEDGREFKAKTVISTLNPEQTFMQLLAPQEVPEDLTQSVETWEWESRSMFGLHVGLHGKVSYRAKDPRVGQAMIVFLGLETEEDLLAHLEKIDSGTHHDAEWMHVTLPSVHDATMAPPEHTLIRGECVVAYDPDWRSHAKAFGEKGIALIREFADLDGEIVLQRCTTPVDIEENLTTMKYGSIKHGAYNPLQLGYLRPNDHCSRSETPIEGLFVGGASMYPGGMIIGGPGLLAATVVGEFLGKPIPRKSETLS